MPGRAFELILVELSDAIVEGRLRPGERLPGERELAETFGVSRPSVREALRALEMFGVLVARRGTGRSSGSTVAAGAGEGLTSALRLHTGLLQIAMADIVDIRAVLESFAARQAAQRAEPQPELHRLVAEMRCAPDLAAYHELDTDFHVALARASGNALLPVLMESLRGAMRRDMLAGFARLEDWRAARERLVAEHAEIAAYIEAGDPDRAADAVQDHIAGFYRTVMDAGAAT